MTTPAQIRAARALLGYSVDRLSAESGVSAFTLIQIEEPEGPPAQAADLALLTEALSRAGIIFIADGDLGGHGAGVRFAERRNLDDGLRPDQLNANNDG